MQFKPVGDLLFESTDEKELFEAITQQKSEEKKAAEKKDFDLYMSGLQQTSEYLKLMTLVNRRGQQLEEARAENDRKAQTLHENERQAFNENIEKYYSTKKNEAIQIESSLNQGIKQIEDEKEALLSSWDKPGGKELWEDKSWEKGVKKQANYFSTQKAVVEEVKTIKTDFINHIKKFDPEIQVDKALQDASDRALQTFEEELARIQEDQINHPMSATLLQIKYAGLVMNAAIEMNKEIDAINQLNKDRPGYQKIPYVSPSVSEARKFAEKNSEKDRIQIMENMRNFLVLQSLDQQKNALEKAKENVNNTSQSQKISHCELQSNSAKAGYDPDAKTRYAMYPLGESSQVIMERACAEINAEKNQHLKMKTDSNSRYLVFEQGDESFRYDKRTGKMSADNITPETLKLMTQVMEKGFGSHAMEVQCDDPVSEKVCKQALGDKASIVYTSTKEQVQKAATREEVGREQVAEKEPASNKETLARSLKPR